MINVVFLSNLNNLIFFWNNYLVVILFIFFFLINKEKKSIPLKLKAALIEVEKAENDLILQRAATRAEVKELNKLAEDTTKGYEERSDAARKAISIEEDLLN